ncbi:(Fe-S)-binding protein [Desulfatiglans anilini]|uniref:(Fe-S)-binding protein n=1 Tax=Desulfatiglans anilini TaxID=90728 RepID=UPI0004271A7C|nr:(Fe-S)-binding protein [Desulfatiglans anilini]
MASPTTVLLFVPCLVDLISTETGEAVQNVLERLGLRVICPERQTCCGQPAFNAGYRQEARRLAKRFLQCFEEGLPIVSPSGSCVHMVRRHYPDLFRGDRTWEPRARETAARTFEFSEFLVDILRVEDVGAAFEGRITYHDSCQLARGLGIREQPRRLLRSLRGAEFVEMADSDRCCGFGGAFSFKYPEISTALVQEKVELILASGADAVAGCDSGCLMNIQGRLSRIGSRVKAIHIARILDSTEEHVRAASNPARL